MWKGNFEKLNEEYIANRNREKKLSFFLDRKNWAIECSVCWRQLRDAVGFNYCITNNYFYNFK